MNTWYEGKNGKVKTTFTDLLERRYCIVLGQVKYMYEQHDSVLKEFVSINRAPDRCATSFT